MNFLWRLKIVKLKVTSCMPVKIVLRVEERSNNRILEKSTHNMLNWSGYKSVGKNDVKIFWIIRMGKFFIFA
jgi:hypothetical protein